VKTGRRLAAGIAVGVIVVDQVTKAMAQRWFADGPRQIIPGLLDFRFAQNSGASFSSFQNSGPWIGAAVIGVSFLILYMIAQAKSGGERAALWLILGGAVGNLIDRFARGDGVLDGAVVDWINVRNFPTFNAADSAVTIGAVILLWVAYRNN